MKLWIFCLLFINAFFQEAYAVSCSFGMSADECDRLNKIAELTTIKNDTLKEFKNTDFAEFYNAKRTDIGEISTDKININQEYATDIYEYLEDFYLSGFITNDQLQNAYNSFMSENLAQSSGSQIAAKLKDIMNNGAPSCALKGEKSNTRSCCSADYIKSPKLAGMENRFGGGLGNSCKIARAECSSHTDCCSSLCEGYNPIVGKGYCADTVYCYKSNELGSACNFESPFCKEGECLPATTSTTPVGSCQKIGRTCSENTQCCSNTCNDGVCKGEGICKLCARYGEVPNPAQNLQCCPGFYKGLMGKCIPVAPTFFSTEVKKEKSWFDYFIPSANANDTVFGTDQHLTPEAREALETLNQQREACYTEHGQNRQNLESCLQEIRDRNLRNTQVESGALSAQANEVKKLNTKVTINNQRSNLDSCEFNSLKDNWMDSTVQEQNAELMLAGFEMMFQGENAGPVKELDDNLLVEDRKNLYASLKSIADKIKRNKTENIKKMATNDKNMQAKCAEVTQNKTSRTDRSLDESNAAGIRLEELMLEWQSLRLNLLVERYNKNAEVEEELFKLIEKYNQIEWYQTHAFTDQMYDVTVWRRKKSLCCFRGHFFGPFYVSQLFNGRLAWQYSSRSRYVICEHDSKS